MLRSIIAFSVHNKLIILLLVAGLIAGGVYSLRRLPIDAVPDITNNQVQVVTVSPSLAPQEVEQFITYPVEVAMANIPDVIEIRSISRFGLSVVTIVFKDRVPILDARQFVKEQIGLAEAEIPPGLGRPELMPITTGLGEIYQYVLQVQPGYEDQYDAMGLRTIQDWIVKRQLAGIPGIIEVSSFGGYLKQYEVALNPVQLQSKDISIQEVFDALARNNQNSGGSYIEKGPHAYYIRTEGLVDNLQDIENIVITNREGVPVLIRHVAEVALGSPKRFGAMTMDGRGEAVGGITLMLKGANSSEAIANVHERVERVKRSLPEGVVLYPYLDRSVLVGKTIRTVATNLLEGGLIVILVLVLLLGNLRAGLVVASVIPLAMLFALIMMRNFGVSANLMSLGAIDFGIVVDGAVIVVEGVMHGLFTYHLGRRLSQQQMDGIIIDESSKLFRSAVFGVFIILIVFVPIMTLTGIEGKMFRPMALTFAFAVLGALLLSLTYVPALSALVLPKDIRERRTPAAWIMAGIRRVYRPALSGVLQAPYLLLSIVLAIFLAAILLFRSLGAEFIPTLEEGDLAMQMTIQPGSSLEESIRTTTKAERVLLEHFPEVKHVVSKIGTAEVPTDPMAIEDADIMIILEEKEHWTSADNREALIDEMKEKLTVIAGAAFEFTQPIQLRFNELMTGAKTDIAVKIFGENLEELKRYGDRAARLISDIPGAGDVRVEQTEGLSQLVIRYDRQKIAEYGLNIEELNTIVRAAYAGEIAGVVFENERKFDLVVRLEQQAREALDLGRLFVHLSGGRTLPLSEVATAAYTEGPMQISREDARRRITIGVNVRNRDVAGLVADIEQSLRDRLNLPPGYSIKYGGEFENLEKAQQRLLIAVPAALALIFFLLFFTFGRLKYAVMIFTAVPMSAIGGIVALWLRGMPFSISAGVGFIALFGVAVLNGIVLISYFNRLRYEEGRTDIRDLIIDGSLVRLRPVIMTATVAAMGFLPMALSTSNGAEVQKPLATVVIGGLITATLLTLLVLPVLYFLVNRHIGLPKNAKTAATVLLLALPSLGFGQERPVLTVDSAVAHALQEHPLLANAALQVEEARLGVQTARTLPPAEINLQLGQMNTTLFDYNVSAQQSLGNIAADRQRRRVAGAETQLAESERLRLAAEITFQVRRTWQQWIYQGERRRLRENQLERYEQVAQKAALQFRAGEIDRLEKTLIDNQVTAARQALANERIAEQRAWLELAQTAFLTRRYRQPPDAPPATVAAPEQPAVLNARLLDPLALRNDLAGLELDLVRKQLAPEYFLGYFNQSIRPDFSLQGVNVGMAVPIFRKGQRGRIDQARLRIEMVTNENQRLRTQLRRQLDYTLAAGSLLSQQLTTSGAALREQAEQLERLSEQQLRAGEIDYFRYAQSLDAALRNRLEYLDLQNQFNQTMIEMDFLTGTGQ